MERKSLSSSRAPGLRSVYKSLFYVCQCSLMAGFIPLAFIHYSHIEISRDEEEIFMLTCYVARIFWITQCLRGPYVFSPFPALLPSPLPLLHLILMTKLRRCFTKYANLVQIKNRNIFWPSSHLDPRSKSQVMLQGFCWSSSKFISYLIVVQNGICSSVFFLVADTCCPCSS